MPGREQETTQASQDEQTFGEMLRAYRQGQGLTQRKLAERVGISQSHFSNIERGRRRPSAAKMVSLTEGLDLPLPEAEDFVRRAGYDPILLKSGHAPLAYSPSHLYGRDPVMYQNKHP